MTAVERAARRHDTVVVHVHCHEFTLGGPQTAPPEFLRTFARETADAGADVVFAQGSHALRGVDSHHGTPVVYDLGGLFRTTPGHPQPAADELLLRPEDDLEGVGPDDEQAYGGGVGLVVRCRVADGAVTEVELLVVRREDGVPRLATDEIATETYDRLRDLSAGFDLTVDDDGTLVTDTA